MAIPDKLVVKAGDSIPPCQGTALRPDGGPKDLTTATSVTFRMTPVAPGLAPDIDAPAVIVGDPVEGVLKYAWQAGDTNAPGLYRAEFFVVYEDGSDETFPTDGYITIEIQKPAVA